MTDNSFNKITSELWLMLACANGDTAKSKNLLQNNVNWDLLLNLALHHQVYPLVYKTLSQLNKQDVPDNLLGFLRQKCQENIMQALRITGETVRIVNCFEINGIRAVVLKGPPLAWRLYGDVAIRPSKDIDILVLPDKLEIAQRILEDEGYRRIESEYPEHNYTPRQLQMLKRTYAHSFHVSYWNSAKNVYIEVHWKLGNRIHKLPNPSDSKINRIEVAGNILPVLHDEDWLLYLMLHGAGHAWLRLRWLIDIAKFIKKGCIDWSKIAFLAKSTGIQSILHQSLILANVLLEVSVPSDIRSNVVRDRSAWRQSNMAVNVFLSSANYEMGKNNRRYINYWFIIYNFWIRIGWKNRLKYLFKLLSPNAEDVKLISLPDNMFVLYYAVRPFSFLRRRLRIYRDGN